MNSDDMQRAMEFIVQQQVQTSTKLDALTEAQKRAEERWSQTEKGIRALLAIAELREKEIQAQSKQISNLTDVTKSTDDRLNALINVVERQIANGRDGKT